MRYATTFSGIGGWEIGLDACGWELAWQCERDEFCQRVLKHHFGVPICPDINQLIEWLIAQFGSVEPAKVDVLVGSPPCQPFSVAGNKRGDSDERHLYPAFIHAVRILGPRYVLMENVAGLLSNRRVFGQYIGGLAALGYDLVWHCIPACAAGAPHRRDRLWIVAHSKRERRPRILRGQPSKCEQPKHLWPAASLDSLDSVVEAIEQRMGEPALFSSDDGISNRVGRLRAFGNAVVPQIPFLIGQAINEIEHQ